MANKGFIGRNLMGDNRELPDQFNWGISFVTFPAAVYYPGDEIFYGRIKEVTGLPEYSHSIQSTEGPGGFKVNQGGDVDHSNATITITFMDYEDESIFYLFKSWFDTIQDPVTKASARKELVICDLDIFQKNTEGGNIVKWMCRTGMPNSGGGYNTAFGIKKQIQGDLSLTLDFEWWDNEMMNA